jgi:hypothetical protein
LRQEYKKLTQEAYPMKVPQILSCIVLAAGVQMAATALALDFRVETDVFLGTEKDPIAENLTLFSDGQVYDFLLSGSPEITIYDPARGQFKLLDTQRKLRSSVSTQRLLEMVEGMETQIGKGDDSFLKAIANPKFETKVEQFEENDETRVRITLTSKGITYKVVGQRPQHPAAVHAYRQFADYFSRFNAVRLGGLPPGARLALDQALAERGLIPIEIERTDSAPGRKLEVRSHHLINWILSKQDRQRITEAGNYLAELKEVDFDEHRLMPPVQTAAKPAGAKR